MRTTRPSASSPTACRNNCTRPRLCRRNSHSRLNWGNVRFAAEVPQEGENGDQDQHPKRAGAIANPLLAPCLLGGIAPACLSASGLLRWIGRPRFRHFRGGVRKPNIRGRVARGCRDVLQWCHGVFSIANYRRLFRGRNRLITLRQRQNSSNSTKASPGTAGPRNVIPGSASKARQK